jgi:hypothetical protein
MGLEKPALKFRLSHGPPSHFWQMTQQYNVMGAAAFAYQYPNATLLRSEESKRRFNEMRTKHIQHVAPCILADEVYQNLCLVTGVMPMVGYGMVMTSSSLWQLASVSSIIE